MSEAERAAAQEMGARSGSGRGAEPSEQSARVTPRPTGLDDLPEAMLRPVRGHHAFETCVGQLATTIRLGVFPYGSSLPPERELAQRMSVSRATLREAIAALRAAGMVTTVRGRGGGTTVSYRPPSGNPADPANPADLGGPSGTGPGDQAGLTGRTAELVDALQFRRIVEPGACFALAARRLAQPDRDVLVALERAVRDAPDAPSHRQADSRFHLAIAAGTGSPLLIASVTAVQADLHEMLCAIPVLEPNIVHSNRQHAAIVSTILAGDPAAARRAMEQHCDDTAALLAGLLGLPLSPDHRTTQRTAP